MNKFHVQGATFIAECWVPRIYLGYLNDYVELKNMNNDESSRILKGELIVLSQNLDEPQKLELKPPTYFTQNVLSQFHQTITDT